MTDWSRRRRYEVRRVVVANRVRFAIYDRSTASWPAVRPSPVGVVHQNFVSMADAEVEAERLERLDP